MPSEVPGRKAARRLYYLFRLCSTIRGKLLWHDEFKKKKRRNRNFQSRRCKKATKHWRKWVMSSIQVSVPDFLVSSGIYSSKKPPNKKKKKVSAVKGSGQQFNLAISEMLYLICNSPFPPTPVDQRKLLVICEIKDHAISRSCSMTNRSGIWFASNSRCWVLL